MCVCFPCGVEYNPTRLPNKYGLVGWIDTCQLCNQVTKVYSNKHFGINPKVAPEPRISASHIEKSGTGLQLD
jgi:hypothetical protein